MLPRILCIIAALAVCAAGRSRIDLNGSWEFQLDPAAAGERAGWASGTVALTGRIQVPGCWQAQGYGEPSGVLRHAFSGAAWYRRTVAIPSEWQGKEVRLRLGGVLRKAALFVNGTPAGTHDGMSAPFAFDITDTVRPGAQNTLVLRVENPANPINEDPSQQAGTEPAGMLNYIGNWGGLYGAAELEAREPSWIEEVAIVSDIATGGARVHVTVRHRGGAAPAMDVSATAGDASATERLEFDKAGHGQADLRLTIPNAQLWSPDHPYLYTATLRLLEGGQERDRVTERFGLREISTRGTVLLLNGKPFYLRGYGDDNIEVITGTPPASKEVYLERLRRAREYGFNAVRFHSMTPVRELFEAADEMGVLVMAELPVAYTMYFLPHKDFLRRELREILRAHRNHPSFMSLAVGGNELNPDWVKTEQGREELRRTVAEFYGLAKAMDRERLILATDGVPVYPTDLMSVYGAPAKDVPTLRHEFGEYFCSLPEPSLIGKFTGVMAPAWLEKKKAWIESNGLSEAYPQYLRNSHRLQQLGHKFQIERVRKQADITGYHYWLIADYPGGTGEGDSWEEGWFDYFWNPKAVTPEEGRELNSPVLILIGNADDDRTMWNGSRKPIEILVSNYGDQPLKAAQLTWRLLEGGREIGSGIAGEARVRLGEVARVAKFEMAAPDDRRSHKLELELAIAAGGRRFTNRWQFWSYPQPQAQESRRPVLSDIPAVARRFPFVRKPAGAVPPGALLIVPSLDARARRHLEAGGRVWVMSERAGRGGLYPAFGGALGTMVEDHPALSDFPHDGLVDLQFYRMVQGADWFALDGWPKQLSPVVGGVRTTTTFLSKEKSLSRFGYIFEAKAGRGKLLVTTLRVTMGLEQEHPEAVSLFDSLLRYCVSDRFVPPVEADGEALAQLDAGAAAAAAEKVSTR